MATPEHISPEVLRGHPDLSELDDDLDDIFIGAGFRTDNMLSSSDYFRQHGVNAQTRHEVRQQIDTDFGEGIDAPCHAVMTYNPADGQYYGFGDGQLNHAITGIRTLDTSKPEAMFEFYRRDIEIDDAGVVMDSANRRRMANGAKKLLVSAPPTLDETGSLEVMRRFNYEGRTKIRIQSLSEDQQTLTFDTFSAIDIPHKAWAQALRDIYGEQPAATGLDILEFTSSTDLIEGATTQEIVEWLLGKVMPYLDQREKVSIRTQVSMWFADDARLQKVRNNAVDERLAFEEDLSRSRKVSTGRVTKILDELSSLAHPKVQSIIQRHKLDHGYRMNRAMEEIAWGFMYETSRNELSVAFQNPETLGKIKHQHGDYLIKEIQDRINLIDRIETSDPVRAEQLRVENRKAIAKANLGCNGGCPARIENMFDNQQVAMLKRAGINVGQEKIYSADSLNKNSRCKCLFPDVRSNGKNVVCLSCGDASRNGVHTNVKHDDKKKSQWELMTGDKPESNKEEAEDEAVEDESVAKAKEEKTYDVRAETSVEQNAAALVVADRVELVPA